MTSARKFPIPHRAIPAIFFGLVAAVPFATFAAGAKNKPITNAADLQIVAAIGKSGEQR